MIDNIISSFKIIEKLIFQRPDVCHDNYLFNIFFINKTFCTSGRISLTFFTEVNRPKIIKSMNGTELSVNTSRSISLRPFFTQ